jgi:hypothetical protein
LALRIAAKLERGGSMSARELKPPGETSRGTYTILTGNHYGWFRKLGGGKFELTAAGRKGLETYAGVVPADPPGPAELEEDVFSGTVEY